MSIKHGSTTKVFWQGRLLLITGTRPVPRNVLDGVYDSRQPLL